MREGDDELNGAVGASPGDLTTQPVGTFRYLPDGGRLDWSAELFVIYGFAAGQVVPTLELMASHQHPQDRPGWDYAITTILDDGRPLSRWHRVINAAGRQRTLQTSIDALSDDRGRVVELRGIVADLTERLRLDRDQEVTRAVTRSAESRSVIDQAKGVLMATMDLDEAQAFELLRWHSSYTNIKLREIATMLLDRLTDPERADIPPRQRLTAVLAGLISPRDPVLPAHRPPSWTSTPDSPTDQANAVSRRIPVSLMPRTLVRAVGAAGVSITIADCLAPDWPLVYVNAAFEKLTGYASHDILGRNCRFLQGTGSDRTQSNAIRAALDAGEEIRTVLRNYRRDGTAFWNELHLSAVRNDAGRITHYIGYQSDVTERVERELQLEHLAYHDPSTSLPNHAAVRRHLDGAIEDGAELTVLHIRLHGHRPTAGPVDAEAVRALLTAAAQRLHEALSAPAFLAKLDDDVFVAVVRGRPESPRDAARSAFDDPVPSTDGAVQLTVSIGHAQYPGDADHSQGLIDAAQAAATMRPNEV